jgi:hypothetical protein
VEAADRTVQADGGSFVVELDDGTVETLEVAGADGVVDAHLVADAQLGQRGRGADGMQEMVAGVEGVGESGEVLVKLAVCNRVKQRACGSGRRWWRERRRLLPRWKLWLVTSAGTFTHPRHDRLAGGLNRSGGLASIRRQSSSGPEPTRRDGAAWPDISLLREELGLNVDQLAA